MTEPDSIPRMVKVQRHDKTLEQKVCSPHYIPEPIDTFRAWARPFGIRSFVGAKSVFFSIYFGSFYRMKRTGMMMLLFFMLRTNACVLPSPDTPLPGHRDALKGCFVSDSGDEIYTVARDGGVFAWEWVADKKGEDDDTDDEDDGESEFGSRRKVWWGLGFISLVTCADVSCLRFCRTDHGELGHCSLGNYIRDGLRASNSDKKDGAALP